MGDRVSWIEQACAGMDQRGIKVTRTSSFWETKAMYVEDQDSFVNGVAEVSINSDGLHYSVHRAT
jgi:2-amino-4-hydroxy-6-hydroxymethyldihydropteridine diphosphokinase/dihydropteroate synthase